MINNRKSSIRRLLTPTNIDIFWNYILFNKRRPFLASYKLTYRCNLTCEQCPFYRMRSEEASFELVSDTLDRLHDRGSRIVIFEGGEPMLWRDGQHTIHDVVQYANERFLRTGMTSNGTLPLDVPTDILWVSLDGLEETHNRLRGRNIFEKVIRHIEESHHPNLFAHITVNSKNYIEIPSLIRFITPLVSGITIQFYYPYNRQDGLFLDFDRREKLLQEIIELKKAGFPIKNSIASLNALKRNRWRCSDWLLDNANPDGSISQGCYVKSRGDVDCTRCGFSPHTELSLAFRGNPAAVQAGLGIFFDTAG